MKIYSKFIFPIDFTTESVTSKRKKNLFEEYFKIALSEIEKKELLEKTQKERINLVYQKLEKSFEILENITNLELNEASSETIGDFILAQALEINKILETLPESSLKNLLKDWAFFVGIEAQKIKQGFYS
jgi:predicted Zn-dependent peptidase